MYGERERIEDSIENVCRTIFNCNKEDISQEQREALVLMYMWGTHTKGFIDPNCSLLYG